MEKSNSYFLITIIFENDEKNNEKNSSRVP
jgi:hypothetical protein